MFKMNKNDERMRRIPGFVPSPEEYFQEEDFDDDDDEVQEEGYQFEEQEDEAPIPNPIFFSPRHSDAEQSFSSGPMDYEPARHYLHIPLP